MWEEDPLATLRMLQVIGVHIFGHVLAAIPSYIIAPFVSERDTKVRNCLEKIQGHPTTTRFTHALPLGACGAALSSIERRARESQIRTYYSLQDLMFIDLETIADGREHQ